jgi:5-(carboxyamino)imidazole ribonucleotide mutase
MKKVGIVMGSDSDRDVAKKAVDILKELEVPYEVHVYSAHRTPSEAAEFAKHAKENGFGALICIAGMAAHLGGVMAAYTTLPVVGVPVRSAGLGGLDALLATVQMPSGIPVATVAVDGAANAALLCCEMFALGDPELSAKLEARRESSRAKVLEKNARIEEEFN